MSDTPKRRGRPPKNAPAKADPYPQPVADLRIKAGRLQRAWQHPTGTQWRDVPVVPESAPDWEDA